MLISEDQYYNTYPGYFTLTAVQNTVVPIFSMKSKYITESGKYRDIPIESAKKILNADRIEGGLPAQTFLTNEQR